MEHGVSGYRRGWRRGSHGASRACLARQPRSTRCIQGSCTSPRSEFHVLKILPHYEAIYHRLTRKSIACHRPLFNQLETALLSWHEDALTIIIDQAIPRSQRLMLEGWFLAWLGVGGARHETAGATDDRTFFLVFMAFWCWRSGCSRSFVANRKEMVHLTAQGMSVKAFNDLGRARFFIKDNIKKMEVVQRDPPSSCKTSTRVFGSWAVTHSSSPTSRTLFVGQATRQQTAAQLGY